MQFVFIHQWKSRFKNSVLILWECHEILWIKLKFITVDPPSSAEATGTWGNIYGQKYSFLSPQKSAADNNKHCHEIFLRKLKFVYIMVGRLRVLAEGKIGISQRIDCNVTGSLFNLWKLGAYNNLPTSGVGLRKSSTKSITGVLTNMGRRHFSGPLLSRHCYRLRPRLQKSHRRSPLSWFSCWNFTFNCQVSISNFMLQFRFFNFKWRARFFWSDVPAETSFQFCALRILCVQHDSLACIPR